MNRTSNWKLALDAAISNFEMDYRASRMVFLCGAP